MIGNQAAIYDDDWQTLERTSFGGPPDLADGLLVLVLKGVKTAACWAARHGRLTHVGKRLVLCDSIGRPRAVVETLSLECRRYCDVDEKFARLEGEGDLSLAWWRLAHRTFFESEGAFAEDMDLWCERFRLVRTLP
jgi:uncharacterized protein YhfF